MQPVRKIKTLITLLGTLDDPSRECKPDLIAKLYSIFRGWLILLLLILFLFLGDQSPGVQVLVARRGYGNPTLIRKLLVSIKVFTSSFQKKLRHC